MFCGHGLFWDQHVFGPNFILTKTTTMTTATSTTSMGFDTIEINLVYKTKGILFSETSKVKEDKVTLDF